jgi:glycosyltransferase involved in cell wall biosynthesis
VIIPALNEAMLLPALLEDLQRQQFQDFEVIVADAGSTDGTVELAAAAGARVVPGGLPGPGRNRGAAAARGDFLFFLDADVRVPADFVGAAWQELEERYLDLATCEFQPLSADPVDRLLHDVVNSAIKVYQFVDPHAPGFCILVTRRLFQRVGGFDETLKLAEDHDFVKRASAFRPLRILEKTYIEVSTRRLDKEGRFGIAKKYMQVELYRLFRGEIRTEVVPYEFGHIEQPQETPWLATQIQEIKDMAQRLKQRAQALVSREHTATSDEMAHDQREVDSLLKHMKTRLNQIFRW